MGVEPRNTILNNLEQNSYEKFPKIIIHINDGRDIRVTLDRDSAPATVANFLNLVDSGYYNGLCFHRIIPEFLIQTGGYYVKGNNVIAEMQEMPKINGEFISNNFKKNQIRHEPGVISMARGKEMNSASTQFFICAGVTSYLDGHYAAFGKVSDMESLEVVMDLSNSETIVINAAFTDFAYPPVIVEYIIRDEVSSS
ncbi:MAG: peptidylprolyl isomerase [Christensenellaceae bacterium]|nr:peptidylprolyl isomerase [Christensenellaceae bacterium]